MTDTRSPERFDGTTTAQVITGLRILSAKLHHDLDGDALSEAADHLAAILARLRAAEQRIRHSCGCWDCAGPVECDTHAAQRKERDALKVRLQEAEQESDEAEVGWGECLKDLEALGLQFLKVDAEREALQARLRAAEQRIEEQLETQQAMKESNDSNYDRWEQAASEREALQDRVTAFEAHDAQTDGLPSGPPDTLAVDLAAFLNVTGEAVADALQAAGCRLEVVRDPSATAARQEPRVSAQAEAVR